MKPGSYDSALNVLLEADQGFLKWLCLLRLLTNISSNPTFLSLVDNYAILCLDIAWCYFKLKSTAFISDAQWRLGKAQKFLEESHGKDMSRLQRLKVDAGSEGILYLRLVLLQAILYFHLGGKYVNL